MMTFALFALLAQAPQPDGAGLEPGRLPREWSTGGPRCMESPDFFIHEYNANFFILRESGCSDYEKPFLFLVFGQDRVLLLDTGAGKSDLATLIDRLIAQWSDRHQRPKPKLIVAHTHSHGDHKSRDKQFEGRPDIEVIPATVVAVQKAFGITPSPAGVGQLELGNRTLDVLGMPGHDAAAIVFYDRRTGILFTGDNIYPGRLYIRDWAAYAQSTQRLVDFAETHLVSHLLGNHIEQSATPFLEYPIGSIYQPHEHVLELARAHLIELNQELIKLKGKPARVALRDLTIYPSTPGTPEMRQTLRETQKRQRATQYSQPAVER
jgi:hydroxyacylglutathione hydrolase